jgi:hypothetical protein
MAIDLVEGVLAIVGLTRRVEPEAVAMGGACAIAAE